MSEVDTEVPFKQYSLRERIWIAWYVLTGKTVIFRNSVHVEAKRIVDAALKEWGIK